MMYAALPAVANTAVRTLWAYDMGHPLLRAGAKGDHLAASATSASSAMC